METPLEIWLSGMFLLGLVSMAVCILFMKACKKIEGSGSMTCLTAIVSLLLFIYLFVALIRPEWF
jgi:K+-transporting ATPase KdpF subunit